MQWQALREFGFLKRLCNMVPGSIYKTVVWLGTPETGNLHRRFYIHDAFNVNLMSLANTLIDVLNSEISDLESHALEQCYRGGQKGIGCIGINMANSK